MSLYHGLFVKATSVPDLNVNNSEGLMDIGGNLLYIAAAATLATVASSSMEKVGILQINTSGTISIKYGAEVAAGSGLATYPAPDANNLVLAELFTAATPIVHGTTAVTNANINNRVLSAEFGGR